MNKEVIHLYGASKIHTYTTVCGLPFDTTYLETIVKRKVTCKRCKKTKAFKGNKRWLNQAKGVEK